ncbi:peptidase, partial [Xanthomonas perforans]
MKSKSMCTTVGLIAMCLAGSAAAAGKPLYQTGPALSRSAAATAAAEPSLQRLL